MVGGLSIGICDPVISQNLCFETFHLPGIAIIHMVEAQQMQSPVNHHMGPVISDAFALPLRLIFYNCCTNDYVAQRHTCFGWQPAYLASRK